MKSNWLIYLILFLLIVNLSVTGTFLVKQRSIEKSFRFNDKASKSQKRMPEQHSMRLFKEHMNLSEVQLGEIRNAHKGYRQFNMERSKELEALRIQFYQGLTSGDPDTTKLFELAEESGNLYANRMKESCKHYIQIRENLSDEEVKIMDSLTTMGWDRMHPEGRKNRKRRHQFNKKQFKNYKTVENEKD